MYCEIKAKYGIAVCIGCPYYKDGKCTKDLLDNMGSVGDVFRDIFK